ncbi:MAG: ubiquinol-cytochrome C chaperone [Alphaproteobacteria bacterium]|nr:ubiquinol-cytochrome C chaperone [Alphaproteobacteria bacterium]
MFKWFNQRRNLNQQTDRIYAATVEQARNPAFYSTLDVPDTLEGRYEMIVLHLFLVLKRLQQGDTNAPETANAQATRDLGTPATRQEAVRLLTERFVTDMDDCMRELGIGDTTVPKKVKRAAAGLFERSRDYRAALTAGRSDLATALAGHIFESNEAEPGHLAQTERLADYTRACAVKLSRQSLGDLLDGHPGFADLEEFT